MSQVFESETEVNDFLYDMTYKDDWTLAGHWKMTSPVNTLLKTVISGA